MWILILMLVAKDGQPMQVESVPGFQSWQACNDAGVEARVLPVLTPPESAGARVDWVCVAAGEPLTSRQACEDHKAALRALREEFRRLAAQTARETDAALEGSR